MSGADTTALALWEGAPGTEELLCAARTGNALIHRIVASPGATACNGVQDGERVIVAQGPALFSMSELHQSLRANRMTRVVLAGAAPAKLVRDAAEGLALGWEVVIATDAPEAAAMAATLFADGGHAPEVMSLAQAAKLWPAETGETRAWRAAVKEAAFLGTLPERLDPSRCAYILVDVQNDFCRNKRRPTDSFDIVDAALPNIHALLDGARGAGCTIVHVQAEYGPLFRSIGHPHRYPGAREDEIVWTVSAAEIGCNGPFLPDAETEVCRAGSQGEAFVGITPAPGEIVLRKHRYSAFVDTGLEALLRARGIETVVIVGVATNVCVESTARDASMRDFYTVVVEDAVGTVDSNRPGHEAALRGLRACFAMVEPTARILPVWHSRRSDAA